MMNREEFIDFMKRVDEADTWDVAEPEEWEKACEYADTDYKNYDNPEAIWDDLTDYLENRINEKNY